LPSGTDEVLKMRSASKVFRRISALALGFPGAHAFNAVLSILFVLVQTLDFSHVLSRRDFTLTVAATAITMYLLPINQSVARANFVLLRQRAVHESRTDGLPEVAAAFQASQAFFILVVLVAPFLIGARSLYEFGWIACFMTSGTFSNIWYSEMQMTMLATNRAMKFEIVTLIRRLISFAILGYLYIIRDIFLFNILAAAQAIVFHIYLLRSVGTETQLFGLPRGLSRQAVRSHLSRLWTSLQATFAEWYTLNAPYAVFMMRFGIGPNLITVDAAMKFVRIIVSVVRNLCEIILPRVSRAVFAGEGASARRDVAVILALGLGGAGVVAATIFFFQTTTFGFLLGHNNTVPNGAGAPIGIAVLASVVFAAAGHLLGHTGRAYVVSAFMMIAVVAVTATSVFIILAKLQIIASLWAIAIALMIVSAAGGSLLIRLLQNQEIDRGNASS
jgi:hypothetical protein